MSTDVPPAAPAPTPRDVARLLARRVPSSSGDERTRQLECLACDRFTDHTPGPATYDAEGHLLVQWWRCLECREASTVG